LRQAPLDARAWLFRVAGNLAVSAARRRLTVRRWAPWLAGSDSEASPEQQYLRREDADRVHAALAGLRADDRVGLLMAAHGCPTPEIAQALGRSELATRSLLCRARIKLRDQVERGETNR
jgi:RNA polymerase sigma factor (sigma-70 family)